MKGKILIADDNADDIFFLSLAFADSGLDCSFVTVSGGEEAIAHLTNEQPPDLLLIDLKMPKVTGFQVLEWIQKNPKLRNLPVVVLSSSNLDEDKKRAMSLGARDYLIKTAHQDGLVMMLKKLHSRFFTVGKE